MVELTYLSFKKTTFLFVFSTYLLMFLLKFRLRKLVRCRIKFHVQRVPTRNTFDRCHYPKNKKYLKNVMMMSSSCFFKYFLFLGYRGPSKVCRVGTHWMRNHHHIFRVFLVFWVAGSIKSMQCGYTLDAGSQSSSRFFRYFLFLG